MILWLGVPTTWVNYERVAASGRLRTNSLGQGVVLKDDLEDLSMTLLGHRSHEGGMKEDGETLGEAGLAPPCPGDVATSLTLASDIQFPLPREAERFALCGT